MANLGGFAGGLAQGYTAGERIQDARSERQLNDRKIKIYESELKMKEADAERSNASRKEMQDFSDNFWKPKEVEETVPSVNDAGESVSIIRKKMVAPDKNSPADQLKFLSGMTQAQLKHNFTPEAAKSLYEYSQKIQQTETGPLFMAAARGDQAALAKVAKMHGGDPSKVKIEMSGDAGPTIDLGNGKPQPLMPLIRMSAGIDMATAMSEQIKLQREGALSAAQVRQQDASAASAQAQANVGIPAQATSNLAQAAAATARAGVDGEVRRSAAMDRDLKTIDAIVGRTFPPTKVKDPVSGSEQMFPHPAANFVQQAVLASPGKEHAAANKAMAAAKSVELEANRRLTALRSNPTAYKQALKAAKSEDGILRVYMEDGLGNLSKNK